MTTPDTRDNRPASFSRGGGCGCKIAPGVLAENTQAFERISWARELLIGIETAGDAAVEERLEDQAGIDVVAWKSGATKAMRAARKG